MELLNTIIAILLVISGLGISAWCFLANRKVKVNIYLSISTFLVTLMVISDHLSSFYGVNEKSLQFTRLLYALASLLIIFIYLFGVYFPVKSKESIMKLFIIAFGIVLSVLSLFSSFIVKAVNVNNGNLAIREGRGGLLFYGVLLFSVVVTLININKKYSQLSGREQLKVQYFILGLFIALTSNVVFSIFFPVFLNNDNLNFLSEISDLFFLGLAVYAIVKHRLMDIRIVVARSVAYAALVLILAGVYAGVIFTAQSFIFPEANASPGYIILQIALAVLIAFTFQPLRKWITRKTDRLFFKNAYDPQKLLDDLSHTMGSTIVLGELIDKTIELLIQEMKVSRGLFVLLRNGELIYEVQNVGYKTNPAIDLKEIKDLANDGTVVYDELSETSHYKAILRKYDASVSIPLKTEKETIGVMLFGEKSSGDMFSQQDLRILEIIAPEISVAIENAKSYEEISRFNVTLRQEVTHATHRLKEKNVQLRELDKAKDEFISMASHQLRTPLTAIKGYLSMLLEGDAGAIKASQSDFINEAYSGANRMVDLINDLLNVSRMDTGRFFIELVDVDVEQMINEEIGQLTNQAKEKGLYLKLEKKGKIPHIWADETKIRQVIMNFIDNAIHYTQKVGVTIKMKKEKEHFFFEVVDTGIGIPVGSQQKLFEKFYRAENARHVRPDGTGLGIYLAKKIIEDHNGEIFFSSIENKGSTFGFRLPLKKEEVVGENGNNGGNKPKVSSGLEAEIPINEIKTEENK